MEYKKHLAASPKKWSFKFSAKNNFTYSNNKKNLVCNLKRFLRKQLLIKKKKLELT